jgi:hypothetical protein
MYAHDAEALAAMRVGDIAIGRICDLLDVDLGQVID